MILSFFQVIVWIIFIIQTVRIILDLSCLADAAHRLGDCAELLRDRACLAIMTIFMETMI